MSRMASMHGTADAAVGWFGSAVEATCRHNHHSIIPLSMLGKSRCRTQGPCRLGCWAVVLAKFKDGAQRKLEDSRIESGCEVCPSHWLRCVAGVDAGEEQR